MTAILSSPPQFSNMEQQHQQNEQSEDFIENSGGFRGRNSTVELEDFTEALGQHSKPGKGANQEDNDTENTTPASSCDNSQESSHEEEGDNSSLSLEEQHHQEATSVANKDQETGATEQGMESAAATTDEESKESSRRVSFSDVEIREYPRCLGDHPCVVDGPPLSIGWKPTGRYVLGLDQYEQGKQDDVIAKAAAQIAAEAKKAAEARKAAEAAENGETAEGDEEEEEEEVDQEELRKVLLEKLKKKPKKRKNPLEYNLSCRTRILILQDECNAKKNPEAEDLGIHCDGAEIKARIREMQKIKCQRLHSQALGEFEDIQLAVEGCRRKVKKMWKKTRKSNKAKKEHEQYKKKLEEACSNASNAEASVPKVQKRRSSLKAPKPVEITSNGKF